MRSTPLHLDPLVAELRDLATVAVGLGVLGVQRANVCRRDVERRLTELASCAPIVAMRDRLDSRHR